MISPVRRVLSQMSAQMFARAIATTNGIDAPAHEAAVKWRETGEDADYQAMLTELDALPLPDKAAITAELNSMMPGMEKVGEEFMRNHGYGAGVPPKLKSPS